MGRRAGSLGAAGVCLMAGCLVVGCHKLMCNACLRACLAGWVAGWLPLQDDEGQVVDPHSISAG